MPKAPENALGIKDRPHTSGDRESSCCKKSVLRKTHPFQLRIIEKPPSSARRIPAELNSDKGIRGDATRDCEKMNRASPTAPAMSRAMGMVWVKPCAPPSIMPPTRQVSATIARIWPIKSTGCGTRGEVASLPLIRRIARQMGMLTEKTKLQ